MVGIVYGGAGAPAGPANGIRDLPVAIAPCQAGDLLILIYSVNNQNATPGTLSGWTVGGSAAIFSSVTRWWYRVATSADSGGTVTVPGNDFSASPAKAAICYAYRGARVDTVGSLTTGQFAVTLPSIAVPRDGAEIVLCGFAGGGFPQTFAAPGLTPRPTASGFAAQTVGLLERPLNSNNGTFGGERITASPVENVNSQLGVWPVALKYNNVAPTAPILTTMADGRPVARQDPNRAAHAFTDPDPGDTQSSFFLRYRPVGAAAWTLLPEQITPSQFYDFPASSLALGNYERQVATRDAQGFPFNAAELVWSPSGFFTIGDRPVGPTIIDPINGQTIETSSRTVTINYPRLQALRWRVLADAPDGSADTSVVLNPGATIVEAGARSFTVTDLVNSSVVHIQVQTQTDGLWSAWVDSRNLVFYTEPAVPNVLLTPDDATGTISVLIDHPARVGNQPTVVGSDIYRRRAAVGGAGRRIATGVKAVLRDSTPASGVPYEYRVLAVGVNGTTAATPWVADAYTVDVVVVNPEPAQVGWQGGFTSGWSDTSAAPAETGYFDDAYFDTSYFD